MGRITVFENPLDLSEKKEYDYSGEFIGFLQEHYPEGFGGRSHVCSFNLDKLEVENYDRVLSSSDTVQLKILPADPGTLGAALWVFVLKPLIPIIVGYLVTQALTFAINKFFGPKGTKPNSPTSSASGASSGGLAAASPTYTLSVPTNAIRLGQPIPVAYGRNLIVPDIASEPHSYYENNDQYVGILLCLGMGSYEIHKIMVANSEITDLAPGTVTATVFNAANHFGQFGIIQDIALVAENVYTSPEVTDLELIGDIGPGDTGGGYSGSAYLWTGAWGESSGSWFDLTPASPQYAQIFQTRTVWATITESGANNGVYQLAWLAYSTEATESQWYGKRGWLIAPNGEWMVVPKGSPYRALWPAPNTGCHITLSVNKPTEAGGVTPNAALLGPYSATTVGVTTSLLSCDIVFPNGVYSMDELGMIGPYFVAVTFTATPINDNGDEIGAPITFEFAETMTTNTAQRRTVWKWVPEARYKVTAKRTTPISGSASEQSTAYWTGLKANLGPPKGTPAYGDVTLIMIKAKATEGLSSDALSRISVDCTRVIPRLERTSRHPVDAFIDIATNQVYGGKRPNSEIDWGKMDQLAIDWADRNFDAVFDTPNNLWEAMRMSIQMQHAAPTMSGAVITVVEDKNFDTGLFSFTEANIKSISITFLFPEGGEVDGVEGEYRDPDDNAQLFALYPAWSLNPESVVLWGCRDYNEALAYVTQRWKQLSLRRTLVTLEVELEGHVIDIGTPINVTHSKFGPDPVICVVHSVKPKDEFSMTIECHLHAPGVFI